MKSYEATCASCLLYAARSGTWHMRRFRRVQAHFLMPTVDYHPVPLRTPAIIFLYDSNVQHQVAKTFISQVNMLKAPAALAFLSLRLVF